MSIKEKFEQLIDLIENFNRKFDRISPITKRLSAINIIVEASMLHMELEEIQKKMSFKLCQEIAMLDLDRLCDSGDVFSFSLDFVEWEVFDCPENMSDVLNNLVNYLTPRDEQMFKNEECVPLINGLKLLCSKQGWNSMGLYMGYTEVLRSLHITLLHIRDNLRDIDPKLYQDYWKSVYEKYTSNAEDDLKEWLALNKNPDLNRLKDKRAQELLKLLNTGIFDYTRKPNQREINECKIVISQDSLESGTKLPDDIGAKCAGFSEFVEVKGDIYCLNYEKLGEYLFKNSYRIDESSKNQLLDFNTILIILQNEMANIHPQLNKYLEKNRQKEQEVVFKNTMDILSTCKEHLSKNIDDDALEKIFSKLLNSELNEELIKKLQGQSKYTIPCRIIAAIKNTSGLFKSNITFKDIARSMSKAIPKQDDSVERYLERAATDGGRIYDKASEIAKHYIKERHI